MCARVIKNRLRAQMRSVLKGLKDPSEAPFNNIVMEEYNMIFGQNVGTFAFWNDYVPAKLIENFSASKEDLPDDLDTYMRTLLFNRRTSGKWLLMARVNTMTGVEVEPAVMEQLQAEPKMFDRAEVLDYLDVVGLRERVKHLNIINHAKGEFYYLVSRIFFFFFFFVFRFVCFIKDFFCFAERFRKTKIEAPTFCYSYFTQD